MHPKDRKQTLKEYEAKATLMEDAGYMPLAHVIMVFNYENCTASFFDPDTLEPISEETKVRRFRAATSSPSMRGAIRRWMEAS